MWWYVFNLIDKVKKLRNILYYVVWDLCRKECVIIIMLFYEYCEYVYFVFVIVFVFLFFYLFWYNFIFINGVLYSDYCDY